MPPPSIVVTSELRAVVARMIERIDASTVIALPGWETFALACGPGLVPGPVAAGESAVVIGPISDVLAWAAGREAEFGFVIPAAEERWFWQRAPRWRSDPTMQLWRSGWSPVAVDRLIIATEDSRLELAVGNARPTPIVSALDDGD